MDLTIEEARTLVSDSALWPRIRDFLWDFAPQVHESWLEGVFASADCSRLQSTVIGSPRVKRFILDTLEVSACFHAFPENDWSRLLLLDGSTLLEICKWLGALACADSLRHVMDGKTVRDLKAALPGVYPEVFGYTMYFKGLPANDAKDANGIIAVGLKDLSGLLSPLGPALMHRLKLKLPKHLCDFCVVSGEKTHYSAVLAKLLKLRFPEAYSLCC